MPTTTRPTSLKSADARAKPTRPRRSAVREFAVNTGVYAAEYGRAAGGVINSVTKSGTNQIHGEAYFYDRESKWNAFNDQTTITTLNPATGAAVTTPFKPEDMRKIYGFTVGGPIIKDKLFFIYTYDQHSRIFPHAGVPTNPAATGTGFNATPDQALPGASACNLATGYLVECSSRRQSTGRPGLHARCSPADSPGYAAAAQQYTAGIMALNTDLGIHPARRLPGDQHAEAGLADQLQGARQPPLPPPALGLSRRRADQRHRRLRARTQPAPTSSSWTTASPS